MSGCPAQVGEATLHQTDITVAAPQWVRDLTDIEDLCRRAVAMTLDVSALDVSAPDAVSGPLEVSLLLTDDEAVRHLNNQYRNSDEATNVLSFPGNHLGDAAAAGGPIVLGDIVLAYQTVAREASSCGLTLADHLSHLVAHGLLHLMGYDHQEKAEAEHMEALEADILKSLGIDDPHGSLGGEGGATNGKES